MIDRAVDYIKQKGYNIYAVAQIRDGVLTERQLQPSNALNNTYSLAKNFTATAVGILEYKGKLAVSDLMTDILKDHMPDSFDPKLSKVTVEHLLTHCMGQGVGYMFESDRGFDYNWPDFILSKKLHFQPGKKMVYSNSCYYLLSLIVENVAGMKLFDFLRQELLMPLEFRGMASGVCPDGHTFGASEMFFRSGDIAKLGQMYMDGGVYGNRRFVSEEWAVKASSPLRYSAGRYYGYSFWRNDKESGYFYGDGAHGQLLLIDKASRTVFVMQGYNNFRMTEVTRDLMELMLV